MVSTQWSSQFIDTFCLIKTNSLRSEIWQDWSKVKKEIIEKLILNNDIIPLFCFDGTQWWPVHWRINPPTPSTRESQSYLLQEVGKYYLNLQIGKMRRTDINRQRTLKPSSPGFKVKSNHTNTGNLRHKKSCISTGHFPYIDTSPKHQNEIKSHSTKDSTYFLMEAWQYHKQQ